MGLDSYLYAKQFQWTNWDNKKLEETKTEKVNKILKVKSKLGKLKEVQWEAIYWRKANHIHSWFVNNCQDGVDECQESDVSVEQLEKLRDICKKIMDNHDLAKELLPTQSGFFFGGEEYDDYYFQEIEFTYNEILKLLENLNKDDNIDFYYQSSW